MGLRLWFSSHFPMYEEVDSKNYDKSVNTFNPHGRLFQIEYACQAISIGAIAISARTDQGIVFAVEKRLPSKLVVESSIKKIWYVDEHLVICSSGLTPDAKKLYNLAVEKSLRHSEVYGDKISVYGMAKFLSETIGKSADLDLKNAYKEDMSLEEATRVVCASLKAVMEEEISVRNIEFAMITERGIESLGDDRKQSLISSIS